MRHRCIRIVAPLVTLVAVLSCGGADGLAPTTSSAIDPTLLAGLYASAPMAGGYISSDRIASSGSAASASAAASAEVSWVSLVPGTVPDGTTATIINLRTAQRITVAIVDGGFDPEPIPASLGDTIEVSVSRIGKPDAGAVMSLAARPGPRIVRSRPPRGQTDAPLNTIITLVFSEPLDPASVNPTTVTLTTADAPVAGAVRILPGPGYTVEFTPSALLAPNATYSLTVSGVKNLAGTPLSATSIPFATSASASTDPVVSLTFSPDSVSMTVGGTLQLRVLATYASGKVESPPYQSLSWSSSAPDVADVDSPVARVIGKAPGTVVITAREFGGATATAHVTVNLGPISAIIASLCDDSGNCGMYSVDPDGSGGHFFSSNGLDLDPIWSPDGSRIAFRSQRGCKAVPTLICYNDLYIMRADGPGIVSSLTAGLEVGGMSWSPDGSRLVFAASQLATDYETPPTPEALYVVNADGSGLQLFKAGPPGRSASWPDWSPDGSKIAYTVIPSSTTLTPAAWYVDWRDSTAIHVVNSEGSNDVRISTPSRSNGDFRPKWSPDGKRISFTRWWNDVGPDFQAFVMNADGSNVTQITKASAYAWAPAWSPDGGSLALISGFFGLSVVNSDGSGGRGVACCKNFSAPSWRRTAATTPAQSRARP